MRRTVGTEDTILIVSDDHSAQQAVSDLLRRAGCAPIAVAKADAVLDRIVEERPQAVLIDLTPGDMMRGRELLGEIRRRHPEVACILLTPNTGEAAIPEKLDFGACVDLHKPYASEQLVAMIHRAIGRRPMDDTCLNERLLEIVTSNLPVVLFALDCNGTCTCARGRAVDIVKVRPEDVVGRSVLDLVEDLPRAEQAFARVLAGEVCSWSGRVESATLETVLSPLRDESDEIVGVLGLVTDVTEQKQAEEAMSQSQEQLAHSHRLVLALSHAGQIVQRASTPGEVYRAIADEVARLGYNTWIFTLAEDGHQMVISHLNHLEAQLWAASSLTGLRATGYRIPLSQDGLFQRIVADGKALFQESVVEFIAEALPEEQRALAGRVADLLGVEQGIIAPLRVGEEVRNLMIITSTQLTEADLPAFSTFAGQAAIALDNARLYDETRRRAERLATVNRIARVASEKLQLDELVETVYQEIAATFEADAFFIALYNEEAAELDFRLQIDQGVREPPTRSPLGSGPTAQIVASKRPFLVSDFAEECERLPPATLWGTGKPPVSWLGVPMRVGERVVGVISMQAYHANAYSEEDALLVSTIADQLAVAVENARLFEAEREQRAVAEALAEAAGVVSSTLHIDQVLDHILEQVERVVGGDASNVLLIDGHQTRAARWRGYSELGLGDWIAGQAFSLRCYPYFTRMIETREPVVSGDTRCDPDWIAGEGQERWRSYVGAPIEVKGEVVGFLSVVGLRPGQHEAADGRRLQLLAGYAAIAIENARLYHDLQIHAEQLEVRVAQRTEQLRAQYAALEAVLHNIGDGIAVTDERGEIILTNPIVDRWLSETLSARDAGQLQNKVREVARRATQRPAEVLELTGLDLQLHAAPIAEPGMKRAHAVVAVHDISHLKELDRLKSRFVSDVSHELRTPVASIRLYTELLRRTPKEAWDEWLDALEEEAIRQARLVEDILEVSQIDSGRVELQCQHTDLNELARVAVASHQALAQSHGVTLSCHSVVPGPAARVDQKKLSQVLANLVVNAIHYTPEGGNVVISSGVEHRNGCDWCTMRVADTGIGIPESELARIFERFYRGTQARVMQVPGTGLGLAIVKEIVELHDGQVTVTSQPGEGTTCTVWLPPGDEPAGGNVALAQTVREGALETASEA